MKARRKILEKNWKDFMLSIGLEYKPMSDKAYEFMENAMEQYAELRLSGVSNKSEQLVCDVCGSTDVIEAPHMGRNCNQCNPL